MLGKSDRVLGSFPSRSHPPDVSDAFYREGLVGPNRDPTKRPIVEAVHGQTNGCPRLLGEGDSRQRPLGILGVRQGCLELKRIPLSIHQAERFGWILIFRQ